jgi:hypothetical protein
MSLPSLLADPGESGSLFARQSGIELHLSDVAPQILVIE